MWSFHQYKRIGQQVRKERRNSPSLENGEKATSKSPVLKDSKRAKSHDDHIYVRESGDDDPLDPKNVCLSSFPVVLFEADKKLPSGR